MSLYLFRYAQHTVMQMRSIPRTPLGADSTVLLLSDVSCTSTVLFSSFSVRILLLAEKSAAPSIANVDTVMNPDPDVESPSMRR